MQTRRQFVTAAGSFTAATVFAPQSIAAATRLGQFSKAHGRFGLDRALQPAARYAEEGFVIAPRVA